HGSCCTAFALQFKRGRLRRCLELSKQTKPSSGGKLASCIRIGRRRPLQRVRFLGQKDHGFWFKVIINSDASGSGILVEVDQLDAKTRIGDPVPRMRDHVQEFPLTASAGKPYSRFPSYLICCEEDEERWRIQGFPCARSKTYYAYATRQG